MRLLEREREKLLRLLERERARDLEIDGVRLDCVRAAFASDRICFFRCFFICFSSFILRRCCAFFSEVPWRSVEAGGMAEEGLER